MRLLLSIALIIIISLVCCIEDIYLFFRPPQAEKKICVTLRVHHPFSFDQEKALGGKRNMALSRYIPLYTFYPERALIVRENIEEFKKQIPSFKKSEKNGQAELIAYFKTAFGIDISRRTAADLLSYDGLISLVEGILTIEESILQNKILKNREYLDGKPIIEIQYPSPVGIVAHPVGELLPLNEARMLLEKKVSQIFWQVDPGILQPVLEALRKALVPNLEYAQAENDSRIEKIIRRYPSKVVQYRAGEVLIPFGKSLTEDDLLLLSAYQQERSAGLIRQAPWTLLTIIFLVSFNHVFFSAGPGLKYRRKPSFGLFVALLVLTALLLKATLLLTSLPVFALPFCILPILSVLLNQDRVSTTMTVFTGAVVVSLFTGATLPILLFFIFSGWAAILASSNVHRRVDVIIPSFVVGLVNVVWVSGMIWNWGPFEAVSSGLSVADLFPSERLFNSSWMIQVSAAFAGGLTAGPLALVLLPVIEINWRTASDFKLSRFIDLQRPVMTDLLTKTPGTYQHSMTVAYLAQAVGDAIGANTLLLRIGAYYHDIGKMANPQLFIENQFSEKNCHDSLAAKKSARLLINHVNDGVQYAREAGLPEVVVDLIEQHHGTQLMEFFYHKACECNPDMSAPREEDFRYAGPKPRSVEAAVLMIVDAVEAASRSIRDLTRDKSEEMIRQIIEKRLADGQFDECNLSTRDVSRIISTLVNCLEASFHSRVEYPWQKKGREIDDNQLGTDAL